MTLNADGRCLQEARARFFSRRVVNVKPCTSQVNPSSTLVSWRGALPPGNAVCGERKHDLFFVEFRQLLGLTGRIRLVHAHHSACIVFGHMGGCYACVWSLRNATSHLLNVHRRDHSSAAVEHDAAAWSRGETMVQSREMLYRMLSEARKKCKEVTLSLWLAASGRLAECALRAPVRLAVVCWSRR